MSNRLSPAARAALGLAAVVAVSGCQIQIPTGLLGQLQNGVLVNPKPGVTNSAEPSDAPPKPGEVTNEPPRVDPPPTNRPGILPGEPPRPMPPVDCKEAFRLRDTDGDGVLSVKETMSNLCAEPGTLVAAGGGEGGGLISNNAGGLIATDADVYADAYVSNRLQNNSGYVSNGTPNCIYIGPEAFAKFDRDGSQGLDPGEWCEAVQALIPPGPDGRPPVMPLPYPVPTDEPGVGDADPIGCDEMNRFDRDGDGRLSWEEYYDGRSMTVRLTPEGAVTFKQSAYVHFQDADEDGDGYVDASEACEDEGDEEDGDEGYDNPCDQQFDAWDIDDNEYLRQDEYVNGRWDEVRFVKAPTPEEQSRMKAGFMADFLKLDRDGDHQLERDEFAVNCQ